VTFARAALIGTLILGLRTSQLGGQSAATLASLQDSVRADSNDPVMYYRLGFAYASAQRYGEAREALRTAISIDPQFADGFALLARLEGAGERHAGPILLVGDHTRFILMLRLDSSDVSKQRLSQRAFLLDPLADPGPEVNYGVDPKWAETIRTGFRAFRRQRWQEAYAAFDTIEAREERNHHPEHVASDVLWYHAMAAARMEHWGAALGDVEHLLERAQDTLANPFLRSTALGPGDYRYVRAYLHQRAGLYDQAMSEYQDLIVRNLGFAVAHTRLAEVSEALGQLAEASIERRRAVDADPDDPSLLLALGVTLARQGSLPAADSAFRAAIAANPRETRAYYMRGLVDLQLGARAEAQAALTTFLTLAPRRYQDLIADARERLAAFH
jgi:tetratricopeptide (TPR) repeat protein